MIRPDVIAGLRQLFAEGTAFAGLLRYIISQHPGERVTGGVVRVYIMEAFGVGFHLPIPLAFDSPNQVEKCAAISASLYPEIVDAFSAWRGEETVWFTGYHSSDAQDSSDNSSDIPIAGMSEAGWSILSEEDRRHLRGLETSRHVLWKQVLLFARLAEKIQQRVIAETDVPQCPASTATA